MSKEILNSTSKSTFGLFGGDISTDASTSGSESEQETEEKVNVVFTKVKKSDDNKRKLPSPGELFNTVKKPNFLQYENNDQINWDDYCKNIIKQKDGSEILGTAKIISGNVPPPSNYEPQTEKIKPTLGDIKQEQGNQLLKKKDIENNLGNDVDSPDLEVIRKKRANESNVGNEVDVNK